MDAPSDDEVRAQVGPAHDDVLMERRQRKLVVSREPLSVIWMTGKYVEVPKTWVVVTRHGSRASSPLSSPVFNVNGFSRVRTTFSTAWASVPLIEHDVLLQEMWLSTRVVMGPDSALRMSQTTRSTRAASVGSKCAHLLVASNGRLMRGCTDRSEENTTRGVPSFGGWVGVRLAEWCGPDTKGAGGEERRWVAGSVGRSVGGKGWVGWVEGESDCAGLCCMRLRGSSCHVSRWQSLHRRRVGSVTSHHRQTLARLGRCGAAVVGADPDLV